MHKGKIEIENVEVPCRRCGKSIRTLKRSLLGANELRDKLGGICGECITPEEDRQILETMLGAVAELETATRH